MVSEPASPARASKSARPKTDRAEKMARVQWGIGLGITIVVVVLWAMGLTQRVERPILDEFASRFFASAPLPSDDLCLITLDDGSMNNVRDWPWPRDMQAIIIDELTQAGAKVIALDLLLHEKGEPHPREDDRSQFVEPDPVMALSLSTNGSVVLGSKFPLPAPLDPSSRKVPFPDVFDLLKNEPELTFEQLRARVANNAAGRGWSAADLGVQRGPVIDDLALKYEWCRILLSRSGEFSIPAPERYKWVTCDTPELPVPTLLEACNRIGSVSAQKIEDPDKIVRRIPLWVQHADRLYPSLGLAAAAEFLGVEIKQIRIEGSYTVIPSSRGDIRLEMHRAEMADGNEHDGLVYLSWPTGQGSDLQFTPGGILAKERLKNRSDVSENQHDAARDDPECGDLSFPLNPLREVPIGTLYEPHMRESAVLVNLQEIDSSLLKVSNPHEPASLPFIDPARYTQFADDSEKLQSFGVSDAKGLALLERHLVDWRLARENAARIAHDLEASPHAADQSTRNQTEYCRRLIESSAAAEQQVRCGVKRLKAVREALASRIGGKLCLVGWVATGSVADFVPTSIFGKTPGPYLHAALINTIFTGYQKLVGAPSVRMLSYLSVAALGIIGTLLAVRLSVVTGPIVLILTILGWLAIGGLVVWDRANWAAAFGTPVLSCVSAWLGVILHRLFFEQRARKQTEARFRSYVSPDVVDILVNNPELQSMAPTRKELTIMFSDVANWTTITERLGTEGVFKFLSTYLREMTDIIQANKATLDKYLGDGIMAFWGAPIDDPEHAQNACKACVEMIQKLNEMNARGDFGPAGSVEVRFGLATGEVNVGDFGNPPSKSAYTVIGDAVNLAARLESSNKQFGSSILMTKRVLELSGSTLLFRPIGRIVVKGKTEHEELYELIGDRRPKGDRTDAWVAQTKKAVEAYQRGELDAAEREWGVLKEEYDDKKLAGLYLAAIARLRETGIPEGFEGELELTEK